MVAITKATVSQGVWKNFFDTINGNVTTVTATDSSTHEAHYSASFPDKVADTKSSYPIVLIESPNLIWERFTLSKQWVNGTIDLSIFSTKAEVIDKMTDDVINLIETARGTFADLGLKFVKLESTSKDEFFRGQIKVHMKTISFSWRYIFTETGVY